ARPSPVQRGASRTLPPGPFASALQHPGGGCLHLEVVAMLALTGSQWNWIMVGAALLILAVIIVSSAIWDRATRGTSEAARRGERPPAEATDKEDRRAA